MTPPKVTSGLEVYTPNKERNQKTLLDGRRRPWTPLHGCGHTWGCVPSDCDLYLGLHLVFSRLTGLSHYVAFFYFHLHEWRLRLLTLGLPTNHSDHSSAF